MKKKSAQTTQKATKQINGVKPQNKIKAKISKKQKQEHGLCAQIQWEDLPEEAQQLMADNIPQFEGWKNPSLQEDRFRCLLPQDLIRGLIFLLANKEGNKFSGKACLSAWHTDGSELDHCGISEFIQVIAGNKEVTEGSTCEEKFAHARRNGFTPLIELLYPNELCQFLNKYVQWYYHLPSTVVSIFSPKYRMEIKHEIEPFVASMTNAQKFLQQIRLSRWEQNKDPNNFPFFLFEKSFAEENRVWEWLWYMVSEKQISLHDDFVYLNESYSDALVSYKGLYWSNEKDDFYIYYKNSDGTSTRIELKPETKEWALLLWLLCSHSLNHKIPTKEECQEQIQKYNQPNTGHEKRGSRYERSRRQIRLDKARQNFYKTITRIKEKCLRANVEIDIENTPKAVFIKSVCTKKE